MNKYIVGGFVRDKLMGLTPHDRDWVVVGSTPEEMLSNGFEQIGKDFPVFIKKHQEYPETIQGHAEEYALARKERKVREGHTGFEVDFSSDVTLEEDLARRDFTFNAMAMNPITNEIIDPYNGQQDLEMKVIRHVSSHFREDPLRVLRAARFFAKFSDFTIHPETMNMMQFISENGELESLSSDRVWKEMKKAIALNHSWRFFQALKECGALKVLFPEFCSINWEAISSKIKLYQTPTSRMACIIMELSDQKKKSFFKRYVIPNEAIDYFDKLTIFEKWDKEESAESIVNLFEKLIKSNNSSVAVEQCCGFFVKQNIISDDFVKRLIKYKNIYNSVKFDELPEDLKKTLKGKQIAEAIKQERIKRIDKLIAEEYTNE